MIDKVAWMPVRDRKVLFARSKGQTLFYCTGGKREAGESDEQTLMREVREEVNLELDPKTIRHIHTFLGPSHTGGEMSMACYDAKAQGEPVASSEIEELAWFTTADKPRTTDMGHMILDWFKAQDLID